MTQLGFSRLGSRPSSFEPTRPAPISSHGFHPPRPVLKRARTPYYPGAEHKRRRTSPTGAFSRLSLSPSSDRRSPTPSSLVTHSESLCAKRTSPGPTETRMRSVYSAYELGPDRVFIESLSDGPSSPSGSEDEAQKPFEIDKNLVAQIDAHQSALALSPSIPLVAQNTPSLETQLVLYRRPRWPILNSDQCSSQPAHLESPLETDEHQLEEIDVDCGDGQVDDQLDLLVDPGVEVPDSMEID